MSKVKKPRTARTISRATAFKRTAEFRRAIIECGGRWVGHGFALIKVKSRTAVPFNVALRITDCGRLLAFALHPAFDLKRLRARLSDLGFDAQSVRTASESTRRSLLSALMQSPPANPRFVVEVNGKARIVCHDAATSLGLPKGEGRNVRYV